MQQSRAFRFGADGVLGCALAAGLLWVACASSGGGGQPMPPTRLRPTMGQPPPATAPRGKSILMLVGNANRTVATGQGIGDQFVKNRLQNTLGHQVSMIFDTLDAAAMVNAAQAADLLLITESTSSANVRADLRRITKPIVSYEAFLQDNLGLTAAGPPGDPGLPLQYALGVKMSDDKIDIVNQNHPLAAGLSGSVRVYTAPKEITWGTVAPTAEVVATLAGDTRGATIYAYQKGAHLFDGTTAAGLRISLFVEDDNTTGTPNLMTADGLKLFDTAISYALTHP